MPADPRTFITVHDGMPEHPKIEGLSDKAFRHMMELWCWCSRAKNDGRIPMASWEKRTNARTAKELLDADLFHVRDGAIYVHDYLEHQRSAAEIDELSAKRREAGKKGGEAKAARLANGVASARASAVAKPKQADSKAVPETETDLLEASNKGDAAQKRGHRLPEDWKPTQADIDWQRRERITDEAARRSTEKFRDHWRAASGQNARKLDWSAAWKNWLRNDADRGSPRQAHGEPRRELDWSAVGG